MYSLTDGIGIQNDLAKLEKQVDPGRKTLKNDVHSNYLRIKIQQKTMTEERDKTGNQR